MKKVLSLLLAGLMVVGMTSAAFAANPTSANWNTTAADGISFADDVNPGYKIRLYLTEGTTSGTAAVPGAAQVTIVSDNDAATPTYTVTGANADAFVAAVTTFQAPSTGSWSPANVVTLTLSDNDDAAVAAVLELQITAIDAAVTAQATTDTLYNGVVTVTAMVPAVPGVTTYLTKTEVNAEKYTAQVKVAGSNTFIKSTSPTIKYDGATGAHPGAAYIEIEFVNPLVSTSSKDFELTAYLRKAKAQSGIEYVLNGTFANLTQTVVDGDDYVYGVDYRVITADANIRKIEVELDYGVTITTRMTDGRKYYGHVSMDPTSADEAIMDKYPNIVEVYNLKTINLNPAGDVVRFGDDAMYAYTLDADGNLVFLGRTNKALPYFTKYFLSTAALDLPEVVEEPEEVVPEIDPIGPGTDNAATGGDDVIVANVNDNPGTGC
jgi:hypothetical protein